MDFRCSWTLKFRAWRFSQVQHCIWKPNWRQSQEWFYPHELICWLTPFLNYLRSGHWPYLGNIQIVISSISLPLTRIKGKIEDIGFCILCQLGRNHKRQASQAPSSKKRRSSYTEHALRVLTTPALLEISVAWKCKTKRSAFWLTTGLAAAVWMCGCRCLQRRRRRRRRRSTTTTTKSYIVVICSKLFWESLDQRYGINLQNKYVYIIHTSIMFGNVWIFQQELTAWIMFCFFGSSSTSSLGFWTRFKVLDLSPKVPNGLGPGCFRLPFSPKILLTACLILTPTTTIGTNAATLMEYMLHSMMGSWSGALPLFTYLFKTMPMGLFWTHASNIADTIPVASLGFGSPKQKASTSLLWWTPFHAVGGATPQALP